VNVVEALERALREIRRSARSPEHREGCACEPCHQLGQIAAEADAALHEIERARVFGEVPA